MPPLSVKSSLAARRPGQASRTMGAAAMINSTGGPAVPKLCSCKPCNRHRRVYRPARRNAGTTTPRLPGAPAPVARASSVKHHNASSSSPAAVPPPPPTASASATMENSSVGCDTPSPLLPCRGRCVAPSCATWMKATSTSMRDCATRCTYAAGSSSRDCRASSSTTCWSLACLSAKAVPGSICNTTAPPFGSKLDTRHEGTRRVSNAIEHDGGDHASWAATLAGNCAASVEDATAGWPSRPLVGPSPRVTISTRAEVA